MSHFTERSLSQDQNGDSVKITLSFSVEPAGSGPSDVWYRDGVVYLTQSPRVTVSGNSMGFRGVVMERKPGTLSENLHHVLGLGTCVEGNIGVGAERWACR